MPQVIVQGEAERQVKRRTSKDEDDSSEVIVVPKCGFFLSKMPCLCHTGVLQEERRLS